MRRLALSVLLVSWPSSRALAAQEAPAIAPGRVQPSPASAPEQPEISPVDAPELGPWNPGHDAPPVASPPATVEPSPTPPPSAAPVPGPASAPPDRGPPPGPPPSSEPTSGEHAEPAPRLRISYANTLVARLNPLGAEDRVSFMLHRRLTGRTGRLFEDNHVGIGLTPSFAPSIVRLGGTLQVVPLAILHLRASYYFISYFGPAGEFKAHAFNSPNADFGPEVIKARSEAGLALTTYGGQAELAALLQFKFGPVALRNEVTFYHNNIKLPGDSGVFYDLRHDVLAPARGWLLSNESDLLYINPKVRLTAGLRATYFHNFYPDSVYLPGDTARDDSINDTARVGPVLAYSFRDRPAKRFLRPTLFIIAQWWVKHRFRTGQDRSQALPLLVLGFSFTGDLWKRP